jgi:hypothetical protein
MFNDSKEAKQSKKISYYSPFKSTNNRSTGPGGITSQVHPLKIENLGTGGEI